MCTCARPYGRAGRCGFGGRGVTLGRCLASSGNVKLLLRGRLASFPAGASSNVPPSIAARASTLWRKRSSEGSQPASPSLPSKSNTYHRCWSSDPLRAARERRMPPPIDTYPVLPRARDNAPLGICSPVGRYSGEGKV
jgi:hypothetical protein